MAENSFQDIIFSKFDADIELIRSNRGQSYLNSYGHFLTMFAKKHNVTIIEAREHPLVKAYYKQFCKRQREGNNYDRYGNN